jgi:hypothetical protein
MITHGYLRTCQRKTGDNELVKQISAKTTSFSFSHLLSFNLRPHVPNSVLSQGFDSTQCRHTGKMPSLQNLPDELLLNVINKLSVYAAMALSQQSRGIHALSDVKNRQKYHQFKFGREKYPQTHEAVLQAGLDTLLAILRTPSLGDYLHRVDLYGTGMIEFDPDSENSIQDSVLSPEDIDRLKQAILDAGFQDAQERESILSMLSRNPAKFQ